MKKQKKLTKRSKTKNASLKKHLNSRVRQEYIDQDYIHKLDDKKRTHKLPDGTLVTELEWMSTFMKEWNSGGVGRQKDASDNKIHRTAKEVKTCTDRTNSRNRDQYGRAKAHKQIIKMDSEVLKDFIDRENAVNYNYIEDVIIEALDYGKKLGKSGNNSKK
jgi:hypothetical protein